MLLLLTISLSLYLSIFYPPDYAVIYRKPFPILFLDHSSLHCLLIYKIFSYTQHEL